MTEIKKEINLRKDSKNNGKILVAEDIFKCFGELKVIEGISLSVSQGDVTAIIGPSGSGKSTFLRCLNKLEDIEGGNIYIDGQPMVETIDGKVHYAKDADLKTMRRKLGMVFQAFHLFPHMSVLKNITEAPIHVLKESPESAKKHAMELLEKVELTDKANCFPCELSGGQQQRVAIARAMAMKPEILCFDEPTSALDPELTGEVLRTMRQLAEEGMTMLVVTHEMSFARDVAHTVVFMSDGRIVEQGDPGKVLVSPEHPRTKAFLGMQ